MCAPPIVNIEPTKEELTLKYDSIIGSSLYEIMMLGVRSDTIFLGFI